VSDLNTARERMAGSGTYTLAIAFGGQSPSVSALTEDWNGASWVEVADLSTARSQIAGSGTQTAGLGFGGSTPSVTAATEEWSGSTVLTKTVDTD
jgi:hypothetical protein